MFFVWDTEGVQRPYVAEEFRRVRRNVRAASAVEATPAYGDSAPQSNSPISNYQEQKNVEKPLEPAVRASDIMREQLVTLKPDDTLTRAQSLFRERRFRHIPVVNDESRPIGILSDRDILRARADDEVLSKPVTNIMATPVITASPETEIRQIARKMFEERIGAIPITDDAQRIIGIVTRSDILRAVINRTPFALWI